MARHVFTALFCTLTLQGTLTYGNRHRTVDNGVAPYALGENRVLREVYDVITQSVLDDINEELAGWKHKKSLADWNMKTNITDHNQQQVIEVTSDMDKWFLKIRNLLKSAKFDLSLLTPDMKKQLELLMMSATPSDLSAAALKTRLHGEMMSLYGSAKACLKDKGCVGLEPDLEEIIEKSRDPELLKEIWVKWRDASGAKMRKNYTDFVALLNMGAKEHGFSDYGAFWREDEFPQTPELDRMVRHLWTEIEPLYLQLHAYTRRKLREKYGSDVVGTDGTIPAHLLGNMWSQQWRILDILSPYPEVDQTGEIERRVQKKYDSVKKIYLESQDFFRSIGLFRMTNQFWENSMLTKPTDREVVCHASAHDLFTTGDFRIKMCTKVTMDDFKTVHHEMGHIEYFMAYEKQPTVYRGGANAAFHEAVGDTIQLSVLSPTHLRGLGLLPETENDGEGDSTEQSWKQPMARGVKRGRDAFIREPRKSLEEKSTLNTLMSMAVDKLAFLPFGYLVDRWRWSVMAGETTQDNLNKEWWNLRLKYQGIVSPVPRSEKDFDPGAKFHIPSNSPYMSYFISHIQQFQMYKALCEAAGQTGPLHSCDFYGSKRAGKRLKSMLSHGASRPWQHLLQELTGSSTVTAHAFREYFEPLYRWLKEENIKHKEKIGWDGATINWSSN